MLAAEGPQPELLGEGGRQEETSDGHHVAVREGTFEKIYKLTGTSQFTLSDY